MTSPRWSTSRRRSTFATWSSTAKVTVVNDPDDLVAKVTPPREEEVIEPVVVEGEEGEEGAEGAEGAEGEGAEEGAASSDEGDES